MHSLNATGCLPKFTPSFRFCKRGSNGISIPVTVFYTQRASPPPPGDFTEYDDVMEAFVRDRKLNGDFVTKLSDEILEKGIISIFVDKFDRIGDSAKFDTQNPLEELQYDSEARRQLNFLRYEALKKELLLLTVGIGTACTGYCLVTLSVQASVSYATGVLFSLLYFHLLCKHVDNISRESVPGIFKKTKSKKIGIRSEDVANLFEMTIKSSGLALSSPRLVIPAAIYALWGLSNHFSHEIFNFQLVPAMVGLFAYKAAALVQVYRDNEDLKFIFPETEDEFQ